MARRMKLLQYQLTAYWRRAFSVRGLYDSGSGFFLLIIAAFVFRYVSILNRTAKEFAAGNYSNLKLILPIVFAAWFLPALERQKISTQLGKFLFLPLSKNEFALVNLFSGFLLPTSLLAAVISMAAIYPFLFSINIFGGAIALLVFAITSALFISAFFDLLKIKSFRVAMFLLSVVFIILLAAGKINLTAEKAFSPANIFASIINGENSFYNLSLLFLFFSLTFSLAFFSARQTLFSAVQNERRQRLQFLLRLRLPFKFGELIKKDFIYSWRILDVYFSILATVFYAVLLLAGDFSFESFSVALAVVVMLSGSLAFNGFGLDTVSGIERLSLLPVKARDLFAAKNKSFMLVIFSQLFFLFPLVFYKFGAILTFIALLKTISIILLYTAWGNYLSVKHPFRMYFYQLAFGGSISAILYGVLIISIFIVAPEFLTAENLMLKVIFNIFSIVTCWLIYKISRQKISNKLSSEWETIALKLS